MTTTANRQTARSQAARDNIVGAALTVFALKGYAATSMDDVCMAAGCSKGGLYHHFRTKSAVLHGVVRRLSLGGTLLPPAGREAAPLPEPSLGRVLLDVWAEATRDDELRAQLAVGYEPPAEPAGAPDGSLAEILRVGALVQRLTRSDEADPAEAARRLGIERAA